MKFWLENYKKSFFISSLTLSSLLLSPVSSFAQDLSDPADASFSCSSAVNVMDCISQTQSSPLKAADPKSLITGLTNQSFNLTGPVSLNVRYDDQLSWIIDGSYAEKFGNHFAIGLKGSYGPNEHRGNATLGFGITPNQQFKLTYEYLAQNLPFDFTSGNVNEWVNQNAFGGAYRYMFAGNSFLKGVEVSGSYTKANSKNLSEAEVYDDNGNMTGILERHIAGGQQKNGLASVIVTPFKYTIIKAGAGYSASSFDTQWDSNQSQSTIAYNVEATHLITPKTLLSTSVNNTATSRAHTVKVSRILPANLEGSVSGQYNFSHVDGISNNGSVSVGLSYPAPKTYTNMFAGSLGDLKSWVQQPVIYNTRVLAISEEKLHKVGIEAIKIPVQQVPVNTLMIPIKLNDYFSFDKTVYSRVDYTIDSIKDINGNSVNTDLKLGIQYVDNSYSANLYSTANMPAAAFSPGKYIVNLIAKGTRNQSSLLTQASNSVEIDVVQNNGIPAANWNSLETLPTPAFIGQKYGPIDLSQYLVGIDGEKFNYVLQENSTTWLKLTTDGMLYSDVGPTEMDGSQANIKVMATSTVSANPANPNSKLFTIQIKTPAYIFPTWSDAWKNSDLPSATPGTDYQTTNSYNNIIKLNPYSPDNGPFLTPTKNPDGTPATGESLTFTLVQGKLPDNSNDQSDCWGMTNNSGKTPWLTVDPTSGQLSGITPFNYKFCNAYIKVTSRLNNGASVVLPSKKISFNNPNFILPAWTGNTLPAGGSQTPYSGFNSKDYLNPLKVNVNGGEVTVADDVWNDFSISANGSDAANCKQDNSSDLWMQIDNNTGLVSAKGNVRNIPNLNATCTITVKFKSSSYNNYVSVNLPITINSTAPSWNGVPSISDLNYDNNQKTLDVSQYIITGNPNDKPNVSYIATDADTLPDNLKPDNSGTPNGKGSVFTFNPQLANVVGPNYPVTNGSFKVQATLGTTPSVTTFNLRVIAALAPPRFTMNLPNYVVDQPYAPINLNAYKPENGAAYMSGTPLLNNSTQILPSDQLQFRKDNTNSTCSFINVSNDGIVSSTKATNIPSECTLVINTKSMKSLTSSDWADSSKGWSGSISTTIKTDNESPHWTNPNGEINFDTYDPSVCSSNPTQCISLTNAVSDGSKIQSLDFQFADTSGNKIGYYSSDGNWQISKSSDNTYYLLKRINPADNTIDAGQINSQSVSVSIIASNNMGSATPEPFSVKVKADDNNVQYSWNAATTNFVFSSSGLSAPLNESIKSTLVSNGNIVIKNNTISIADSANTNVVNVRSGDSISMSGNKLSVPSSVFSSIPKGNNAGVYPNNSCQTNCDSSKIIIKGITSTASSAPQTLDLSSNIKIYIKGLYWYTDSNAAQSIKFDAVDINMPHSSTEQGKDGYEFVILNKYLASDPVSANFDDFQLEFASGGTISGDWQITSSSDKKTWYLIRGGNKDLDVNQISNTPSPVPAIIQKSNTGSSSTIDTSTSNLNISLKILADPDNIILMYYNSGADGVNYDPTKFYVVVGETDLADAAPGLFGALPSAAINMKSCLIDTNADYKCSKVYTIKNDKILAHASFPYNAYSKGYMYNNVLNCTASDNGKDINNLINFIAGSSSQQSWVQLYGEQKSITTSLWNACVDSAPNKQVQMKIKGLNISSSAQGGQISQNPDNLPDIDVMKCTASSASQPTGVCNKN